MEYGNVINVTNVLMNNMKIFTIDNKPKYLLIASFIVGMIIMAGVYEFGIWFSANYRFQPMIVPQDISPVNEEYQWESIPKPTPTPEVKPQANIKGKSAIVTAYSCGGLTTDAEIDMNCPSLRNYPEGRTATGTIPIPNKTVACDKANLGRTFHLEGIGNVVCEDTGGAIQGSGRFDLYLSTVEDALAFGRQNISYYLVK